MAISQGSASKIGFIEEVTWGTTPALPELTTLPVTSFNINLSKDEFEDTAIRGDRMQRYSLSGNKTVGGDIAVLLSPGNFDPFLESAMSSAFDTNVLKVGSTRKSFTFEHAQEDIGIYIPYTGVLVDKFAMSVATTGIVTGTFTVVGKSSSTAAGSTIDNAGGYSAEASNLPFTHVSGSFNEGGAPIGLVTTIALTIDNGYSTNFALGNVSARDLTYSFIKLEGTVTAYFEDAVLINKFINGSASSLNFTLTNGTKTLQFNMPNIKYTGASKSLSGSGPVVLNLPFKALFDAGTGSIVTITRT